MELKTESRRIFQNGVPMQDTFLCVHSVLPAGPCHQAGIRAGDVIVAWAGQRLTSKSQWADKVSITKPGDVVSLSIYTSGDSCRDLHVTVGGTTRQLVNKPAAIAKPGAPKPAAKVIDDDEGILGW
jgi:S1-C subfamily serine protease